MLHLFTVTKWILTAHPGAKFLTAHPGGEFLTALRMPGHRESVLMHREEACHSDCFLRTLLYNVLGGHLGIDPTYIPISVGIFWAINKLWNQLYTNLYALAQQYFMASIEVSGTDDIYSYSKPELLVRAPFKASPRHHSPTPSARHQAAPPPPQQQQQQQGNQYIPAAADDAADADDDDDDGCRQQRRPCRAAHQRRRP
ncbi:hypothetical protein VTK56DRAFT_7151 [Thermocarpiscus australiensis]